MVKVFLSHGEDNHPELELAEVQRAAVVAEAVALLRKASEEPDPRWIAWASASPTWVAYPWHGEARHDALNLASKLLDYLQEHHQDRLSAPAYTAVTHLIATNLATASLATPSVMRWEGLHRHADHFLASSIVVLDVHEEAAVPQVVRVKEEPEPGGGPTMTVSTSLRKGTVDAVRARVGKRQFSQYVEKAVLAQIARDDLREILDDYEAKVGAPREEDLAKARALLLGGDDTATSGGSAA